MKPFLKELLQEILLQLEPLVEESANMENGLKMLLNGAEPHSSATERFLSDALTRYYRNSKRWVDLAHAIRVTLDAKDTTPFIVPSSDAVSELQGKFADIDLVLSRLLSPPVATQGRIVLI